MSILSYILGVCLWHTFVCGQGSNAPTMSVNKGIVGLVNQPINIDSSVLWYTTPSAVPPVQILYTFLNVGQTFTGQDLQNNNVVITEPSASIWLMNMSVSWNGSTTYGTFVVTTCSANIASLSNTGLTVLTGSTTTLSTSNLQFTSGPSATTCSPSQPLSTIYPSCTGLPDSSAVFDSYGRYWGFQNMQSCQWPYCSACNMIYNVTVAPSSLISFQVRGTNVAFGSIITQADIDEGQVVVIGWANPVQTSVSLAITAFRATTVTTTFNILVCAPPTLVVNNAQVIAQNTSFKLSTLMLRYSSGPTACPITYTLTSVSPSTGQFSRLLNVLTRGSTFSSNDLASGLISFNSSTTSGWANASLTISCQTASTTDTFSIAVCSLVQPALASQNFINITMMISTSVSITPAMLVYTAGPTICPITYTLMTTNANVAVLNNNIALTAAGMAFSQSDVNNGLVSLQARTTSMSTTIQFNVTSLSSTYAVTTLSILICAPPTVVNNIAINVAAAGIVVLNSSMLLYSSGISMCNVTYTMVGNPLGTLLNAGMLVIAGSQFMQNDINSGNIIYQASNSTYIDTLNFTLSPQVLMVFTIMVCSTPVVVRQSSILQQGLTYVMDTSYLMAISGSLGCSVTYTLLSSLNSGCTLSKRGIPLTAGSQFSQTDLTIGNSTLSLQTINTTTALSIPLKASYGNLSVIFNYTAYLCTRPVAVSNVWTSSNGTAVTSVKLTTASLNYISGPGSAWCPVTYTVTTAPTTALLLLNNTLVAHAGTTFRQVDIDNNGISFQSISAATVTFGFSVAWNNVSLPNETFQFNQLEFGGSVGSNNGSTIGSPSISSSSNSLSSAMTIGICAGMGFVVIAFLAAIYFHMIVQKKSKAAKKDNLGTKLQLGEFSSTADLLKLSSSTNELQPSRPTNHVGFHQSRQNHASQQQQLQNPMAAKRSNSDKMLPFQTKSMDASQHCLDVDQGNTLLSTRMIKDNVVALPGFRQVEEKDFRLGKKLYQGGAGSIYECSLLNAPWLDASTLSSRRYVVKIINAEALKRVEDVLPALQYEVAIHYGMSEHNNIAKLVAFCEAPPAIVMERFDMDLASAVTASVSQTLTPVMDDVDTMLQIAEGVQYLHSRDIVHNDLKLTNILGRTASPLDRHGSWLWAITDFGIATHNAQDVAGMRKKTVYGFSVQYAAPEILMTMGKGSTVVSLLASDIYSLSVIFWAVAEKDTRPWHGKSLEGITSALLSGERLKFSLGVMQQRVQLVALIEKMWLYVPMKRPAIKEVVEWLYNDSSPSNTMLHYV